MNDNVNNPQHYQFSNGAQVVDITENLSFNAGNVIKYCARAGRKTASPLEDLEKARFYLNREILRLLNQPGQPRIWYSYAAIPKGVDVEDKDGDAWWGGDEELSYDDDPGWVNSFAPFTEVIGTHDE